MAKSERIAQMSNKEFARAVGCHFSTASRYRNGRRLPGVEILRKIADVLEVSVEDAHGEWSKGKESFGAWLRERVFADEAASA